MRAEAQTTLAETAILDALSRLLLTSSLDDITVAQVLAEAEVSRATFYFYFASIDQAFVALLTAVLDQAIEEFRALLGDPALRRSPEFATALTRWLSATGLSRVVIRNAAAEWPRRSDVRAVYLDAVGKLTDALAAAIDEDRAAGVALDSIPSGELAAGWVWTSEQRWYLAADPEEDALDAGLASLLVAAVYGRAVR